MTAWYLRSMNNLVELV